jgi:SAM-dependent methyltransferase
MRTLAAANPALEAYESLGPFYDAFTAHHDYEDWTRSIERLARQHGLAGDRLLDLGCGTGRSFQPWLRRGWHVTGCDQSPAMLAVAARRSRGKAQLHCEDIRAVRVPTPFDLVLMLDDVANYLDDVAALQAAFVTAARAMHQRSLFVFDANSLATYRGFFAETYRSRSASESFVWQGRTPASLAPGGRAEAHLEIFSTGSGSRRRLRSVHLQRHHTARTIHAAAARAGLELIASVGMTPDGVFHHEFDELRHTKALYLARARA